MACVAHALVATCLAKNSPGGVSASEAAARSLPPSSPGPEPEPEPPAAAISISGAQRKRNMSPWTGRIARSDSESRE